MSIINKLVAVFGLNTALTATYVAGNVVYADGSTTLSFPVGKDGVEDKKPGVYNAELKEKPAVEGTEEAAVEYELVETLAPVQPTAAAAPEVKPRAKQTPDFGFQGRERF